MVQQQLDFRQINSAADAMQVLIALNHDILKRGPAQKTALSWLGMCILPSHQGKKLPRKFYLNPEKRKWHCMQCKAKGDLIDLVSKLRNVSLREAAQWIQDLGENASGEAAIDALEDDADGMILDEPDINPHDLGLYKAVLAIIEQAHEPDELSHALMDVLVVEVPSC